MNINKHNYEAFFLDYHEGNLMPQQVADLLLFVEQHPELKAEFENFENFTLDDYSDLVFDNKEGLKKNRVIDANNREDYFIRSIEGTLNKAEENVLTNFLKQHPQFLAELNLFQKTKLLADANIIFDGKENLKQIPETADNLLISAIEGLLSIEEDILLKEQLSVDPEMKQEFILYQQTKLNADAYVVYKNKEELKHKERKVTPMFYYIFGIAAAILLLFGLFTFFNNGNTQEKKLAAEIPFLKNQNTEIKSKVDVINAENKTAKSVNILAAKKANIKNDIIDKTPDSVKTFFNAPANNFVQNTPEDKQEKQQEQITPKNNEPVNTINSNTIAIVENIEKAPSKEFLSLGQIAAAKIKEKTLAPDAIAAEKKNGSMKKLSGWDVAQIIAKGVSKVTGKKVEAKPTYNEEGEVTAYALGAGGFQISRGK